MLYITAEDETFDIETMKAWRDEGFIVEYIPLGKGGKQYVQMLHKLGDKMGIGERYAIVGICSCTRRRKAHSALHQLITTASLRRCSSHMPRRLLRAQNCNLETLLPHRILPNLHPRHSTPLYILLPRARASRRRHIRQRDYRRRDTSPGSPRHTRKTADGAEACYPRDRRWGPAGQDCVPMFHI
jgi:hypothetical protein